MDLMTKMANGMMNILIWAIIAALSFICIYIVYDGLRVTRSVILGDEILAYAPSDEKVDLEALKEINSDIVGWVKIDDTTIDYPIVQSFNNEYYLDRNYLHEFATAGSIFLDYRNDLDDNFLIVYGHRMSYGGMFSDIIKFQSREYFNEHKDGKIYLGSEIWPLEIIAFGIISAENRIIYDLKDGVLREIMTRAAYVREIKTGRFVMLSTCDAQNKSMRDILLAQIVEK